MVLLMAMMTIYLSMLERGGFVIESACISSRQQLQTRRHRRASCVLSEARTRASRGMCGSRIRCRTRVERCSGVQCSRLWCRLVSKVLQEDVFLHKLTVDDDDDGCVNDLTILRAVECNTHSAVKSA